jgi:hypothetical protein
VVSLLRMYSVPELRELTAGLDHYHWDIGTVRAKPIPIQLTYLIGVPVGTVAVTASPAPGAGAGEESADA